ncbi:LysR family transcriptional regulator, partial [Streptococcus pasteurianus]|nr:LysR family transcriptional regulator [Streptococcus pasteurianus]
YYDLSTFNRCEQTGAILLSLDVWEDIHPSLITIPLAWSGPGVPYGIIYSKEPNDQVAKFIKVLANLH